MMLIRRNACTLATLGLLAGLAQAEGGVPPEVQLQIDQAEAAGSTLTRAEVRAEVLQAAAAGMLLAAGDLAEPPSVFDARERYNVAQAREIAERYARIEEENAAVARAAALQLQAGRQVASASPLAALDIITERADGSPLDDEPSGEVMPQPLLPPSPEEPSKPEAPIAPNAVLHERRD